MICKRDKRPSPKPIDFVIPFAETLTNTRKLTTRGSYKTGSGNPEGIIIHFTAGQEKARATDFFNWMNDMGFATLFIDHWGKLWQNHKLDQWGYHAGKSKCPVTNRSDVSKYYIGIEVANPGMLKLDAHGNLKSWFNKYYSRTECRLADYDYPHQDGWYYKFTEQQEDTLRKTVEYLMYYYQIPSTFVFGHDEISPGRKNDPGGALSMSMRDFRNSLK